MPASSTLDKRMLRTEMRARRVALPEAERLALSRNAARRLLATQVWQDARTVALYMAVRGETDASRLLEAAWHTGKTVLLPLCSRTTKGEMRFVPVSGSDGLTPGPYGIPEPLAPEATKAEEPPAPLPDLILVPGVAFDRSGWRLGQGGGYYDRLLGTPPYAASLRMGFAYTFQLVRSLPRDVWDLPMHALCTDEEIIWIKNP